MGSGVWGVVRTILSLWLSGTGRLEVDFANFFCFSLDIYLPAAYTFSMSMRLFGINITFKKEPRWVSREEFQDLSRLVQDMSEGVDSNRKAIEANRKRIERAKIPDNGSSQAEAEALLKAEAREELPESPVQYYRTGDPVNI